MSLQSYNTCARVRPCAHSFEDFLETLMRIATMKCLPDDETVFDAGYEDAGDFILNMRNDNPAKYAAYLRKHARNWDDPLPQSPYRLIECLCILIMRTIERVVATAKKGAGSGIADMEALTVANVALFQKMASQKPTKGKS